MPIHQRTLAATFALSGIVVLAACPPSKGRGGGADDKELGPNPVAIGTRLDECGTPLSAIRVSQASFLASASRGESMAAAVSESLFHRARIARRPAPPPPPPRPEAPNPGGSGGASPTDNPQLLRLNDSAHVKSVPLQNTLNALATPPGGPPPTPEVACSGVPTVEYQDAQRLVNEDGFYGPVVQVIVPPKTDTLKSASQFDGKFVLVALAGVQPDSGMTEAQYATLSSYRPRLHLELGSNCIFLQHGPRGWNARIVPGTPGCSAAAAAAAPPLEVSQGPPQPTDSVPAAARIVEGRGLMPFIGVRCANAWCVVGPGAATGVMPSVHRSPTALAQPFAPTTTSKTLIGAWYDEQHLAVWDSVAKRWKPGFIASVVPDPNLRARPVTAYDLGFQQVASLYSPGAPPEKYANGFGYARGWNRIYLRRDSTGAWDAIVIGADSVVHYRTVHLYQHTTGSVPGSVRFEWREDDEWVWIPCDAGCCLVQEGIG